MRLAGIFGIRDVACPACGKQGTGTCESTKPQIFDRNGGDRPVSIKCRHGRGIGGCRDQDAAAGAGPAQMNRPGRQDQRDPIAPGREIKTSAALLDKRVVSALDGRTVIRPTIADRAEITRRYSIDPRRLRWRGRHADRAQRLRDRHGRRYRPAGDQGAAVDRHVDDIDECGRQGDVMRMIGSALDRLQDSPSIGGLAEPLTCRTRLIGVDEPHFERDLLRQAIWIPWRC